MQQQFLSLRGVRTESAVDGQGHPRHVSLHMSLEIVKPIDNTNSGCLVSVKLFYRKSILYGKGTLNPSGIGCNERVCLGEVVALDSLFVTSHGRFNSVLLTILSQHSLTCTGEKGDRNEHRNCRDMLDGVLLSSGKKDFASRGLRPNWRELLFAEARRMNATRVAQSNRNFLFELENGTIIRLSRLFLILRSRHSGDPHRHNQNRSLLPPVFATLRLSASAKTSFPRRPTGTTLPLCPAATRSSAIRRSMAPNLRRFRCPSAT